MDKVVIIGGGFAGLAAGVLLADRGVPVTLLERRKHLGGRAYSFTDRKTGDTVDNGQHLFMACYGHTRDFLSRIGTAHHLRFQRRLHIEFRHPQTGRTALSTPPLLPASLALAAALLRLKTVRLPDILRLRHVQKALHSPPSPRLSVEAWLDRSRQSPRIRRAFWHPLCVSALNQPPESAPAAHLVAILRDAFFGPANAAALGYAGVGLSALYTDAARAFIERAGGCVRTATAVIGIDLPPDGKHHILLKSGTPLAPAACICAVPPPALVRLLPETRFGGLIHTTSRFRPSPILSVNLWLDRPVLDAEFTGLLDTRMHWIFNKPALYAGRDRASEGHLTLVASAADALADRPDPELIRIAVEELEATVPRARGARLEHARVIRERWATFALPLGLAPPATITDHPGLFLAGDWTDTGLPATIEGAVKSGYRAAESALNYLSK